jgi:hypothetical protein
VSNSMEKFQDKWVRVQDKCGKCKRKPKTTLQYAMVSKTDHSFVPRLDGIEVKV